MFTIIIINICPCLLLYISVCIGVPSAVFTFTRDAVLWPRSTAAQLLYMTAYQDVQKYGGSTCAVLSAHPNQISLYAKNAHRMYCTHFQSASKGPCVRGMSYGVRVIAIYPVVHIYGRVCIPQGYPCPLVG